jgi:hypothetical protein
MGRSAHDNSARSPETDARLEETEPGALSGGREFLGNTTPASSHTRLHRPQCSGFLSSFADLRGYRALAPMQREPSTSRRKPPPAARGGSAGSLSLCSLGASVPARRIHATPRARRRRVALSARAHCRSQRDASPPRAPRPRCGAQPAPPWPCWGIPTAVRVQSLFAAGRRKTFRNFRSSPAQGRTGARRVSRPLSPSGRLEASRQAPQLRSSPSASPKSRLPARFEEYSRALPLRLEEVHQSSASQPRCRSHTRMFAGS